MDDGFGAPDQELLQMGDPAVKGIRDLDRAFAKRCIDLCHALADRFGRRPALMIDIICFSIFELGSAFAPSLRSFLIMRAFFGIAMGGEWGVGAALAFETLAAKGRGFFSGLLQEGYVVGYLLAAVVYGTLFRFKMPPPTESICIVKQPSIDINYRVPGKHSRFIVKTINTDLVFQNPSVDAAIL